MEDAQRWVYTDKQLPSINGAMAPVSNEIKTRADGMGIQRTVLELVNLRCSQINGCAFCLHLHTHLALRGGESPERIAVLPAWRARACSRGSRPPSRSPRRSPRSPSGT